MRIRDLALGLILALAGCSSTPAAPDRRRADDPRDSAPLQLKCEATSVVRCTAFLFGEGDVTTLADWWVTERFAGDRTTISPAADFPSPGLLRPLQRANVYVRAEYQSPRWGHKWDYSSHSYAIDPGAPPVPLAFVDGEVRPIMGGVTVEIISGEGTGKSDVTRDNGFFIIEHLRLGVPFTARASKPGYTSDVEQHPGIVDSSTGHPANTGLLFTLTPLASPAPTSGG